jgi:hypothetical protein
MRPLTPERKFGEGKAGTGVALQQARMIGWPPARYLRLPDALFRESASLECA